VVRLPFPIQPENSDKDNGKQKSQLEILYELKRNMKGIVGVDEADNLLFLYSGEDNTVYFGRLKNKNKRPQTLEELQQSPLKRIGLHNIYKIPLHIAQQDFSAQGYTPEEMKKLAEMSYNNINKTLVMQKENYRLSGLGVDARIEDVIILPNGRLYGIYRDSSGDREVHNFVGGYIQADKTQSYDEKYKSGGKNE